MFREAFRDLIVHVQTFGPLLAKIKQEYEDHLEQEARDKRILQVTDRQERELAGLGLRFNRARAGEQEGLSLEIKQSKG